MTMSPLTDPAVYEWFTQRGSLCGTTAERREV